MMRKFLVLFLVALSCIWAVSVSYAAYPGKCNQLFYKITQSGYYGYVSNTLTVQSSGTIELSNPVYVTGTGGLVIVWNLFYDTDNVLKIAHFLNNYPVSDAVLTQLASSAQVVTLPASATAADFQSHYPACPSQCSSKKDQVNYNLEQHLETSNPSTQDKCYEDCRQKVEILWEDCINGSCVSSMKYTYTGDECTGQPGVSNIDPDPPQRCDDELLQLITQCGGTLNVQSFNFETCTGTCTPDSCQTEYAELLNRCGGFMGIATWDSTTCKGTCTSDPLPTPPTEEQKPPEDIAITETVHADGSKEVSQTTSYVNQSDGYTYNTTTTTTYDAAGAQTGRTTTTTKAPSSQGSEESFSPISSSGFGEAYTPGEAYDVPTRFNTFLNTVKSTGLFSFSSGFFNSIPGGGSPVYTIDGGQTFGTHFIDLSDSMSIGLAVLKSILLACFGFLSIRAIIMKR